VEAKAAASRKPPSAVLEREREGHGEKQGAQKKGPPPNRHPTATLPPPYRHLTATLPPPYRHRTATVSPGSRTGNPQTHKGSDNYRKHENNELSGCFWKNGTSKHPLLSGFAQEGHHRYNKWQSEVDINADISCHMLSAEPCASIRASERTSPSDVLRSGPILGRHCEETCALHASSTLARIRGTGGRSLWHSAIAKNPSPMEGHMHVHRAPTAREVSRPQTTIEMPMALGLCRLKTTDMRHATNQRCPWPSASAV